MTDEVKSGGSSGASKTSGSSGADNKSSKPKEPKEKASDTGSAAVRDSASKSSGSDSSKGASDKGSAPKSGGGDAPKASDKPEAKASDKPQAKAGGGDAPKAGGGDAAKAGGGDAPKAAGGGAPTADSAANAGANGAAAQGAAEGANADGTSAQSTSADGGADAAGEDAAAANGDSGNPVAGADGVLTAEETGLGFDIAGRDALGGVDEAKEENWENRITFDGVGKTGTVGGNIQNAQDQRTADEVNNLVEWGGPDTRKILTETGIPNGLPFASGAPGNAPSEEVRLDNEANRENHARSLNIIAETANAAGISVAPWSSGHAWNGDNPLSVFESGQDNAAGNFDGSNAQLPGQNQWQETPISDIVTDALGGQAAATGRSPINYAGNEFGPFFAGAEQAPEASDFAFHKEQGFDTIRYPLGQGGDGNAHLDPDASGAIYNSQTGELNQDRVQHVGDTLNAGQEAGVGVILDVLHPGSNANYARVGGEYITEEAGMENYQGYVGGLLNSEVTDANGNNILLKDHPALAGIEIANEPHGRPLTADGSQVDFSSNEAAFTDQDWERASQEVVDFLRGDEVGFGGEIFVPFGGNGSFSAVQDLADDTATTVNGKAIHRNGPWINDPLNNTTYVGHYYAEDNHSSQFANGYDNDVMKAEERGYSVS